MTEYDGPIERDVAGVPYRSIRSAFHPKAAAAGAELEELLAEATKDAKVIVWRSRPSVAECKRGFWAKAVLATFDEIPEGFPLSPLDHDRKDGPGGSLRGEQSTATKGKRAKAKKAA